MSKYILITGACGFIGHHLVEYLLKNTEHNIYIIDKLSYASCGLDRLREIDAIANPRVHLFIYDLTSKIDEGLMKEFENIEWIIHLAAETHVDKSVADPCHIIMNNVKSTLNLLEFARKLKNLKRFLYFSTDEVYGTAPEGIMFDETSRHNPSNPYSASKSASEVICKSYENTFGIPLIVCNVANVYGERQHNEKFIPICIKKLLYNETVMIHTYPAESAIHIKSGSRFYIYAKNVASAIYFIMQNGKLGEFYNIAGEAEIDNNDVCDKIASLMHKEAFKEYVSDDKRRPNHDLRYGLNGSKLEALGWKPESTNFETYLKQVVEFTLANPKWL